MRFVDVKRIALYYKAIPGMLHLLRQERAELEEEYNGLGSTAADGTPHGSSPGKPTEELGLRALENGTGERLAQIAEQERVLLEDQAVIRVCLDGLNSTSSSFSCAMCVGTAGPKSGCDWVRRTVRPGAGTSGPWSGWARPWRRHRITGGLRAALRTRVPNKRRKIFAGKPGRTGRDYPLPCRQLPAERAGVETAL